MPVRPMTDEEAERYFGGGLVIFGQKRPRPSSESSETPASSSANEPDPMRQTVGTTERASEEGFGDPAEPGSQEAHDRWLQRQSTSQLKTLARNLAALMRAREEGAQTAARDLAVPEGKERIGVPAKFPPGCVFVASFSGDEFVKFPDGKVFKASDDGETLIPAGGLPDHDAAFMSEEGFLSTCARSSEFLAQKSASASAAETPEMGLQSQQHCEPAQPPRRLNCLTLNLPD